MQHYVTILYLGVFAVPMRFPDLSIPSIIIVMNSTTLLKYVSEDLQWKLGF